MELEKKLRWGQIRSALESILFVARQPLTPQELAEILGLYPELVHSLLEDMTLEYQKHGVRVVKVAGGYLMGTAPQNADYVHKILHRKVETTLSPQALETLAIIAYSQPVTQAEIERVRGVNSDGPISTLIEKKLVLDIERADAPGRPYVYGTTSEFLRHFGLGSLADLPPLPNSKQEQEALFKSALRE